MDQTTLLYLIYVLAAGSAVLAAEALFLSLSAKRRASSTVNRRLKTLAAENVEAEANLRDLLRERGLDNEGDYALGLVGLNRLYTQSGVTGSMGMFFGIFAAAGLAGIVLMRFVGMPLPLAVLIGLLVAGGLPLFILRNARKRRVRKFERQLPEALEMMVRSMRSGHPTSVAVGLVAREMPDPIGTEFGIVSDEITFGQTLEAAVVKMAERVGFEAMQLLSVSLSISARTGGNLTEILGNLATVLRERNRTRMKIRSLSAEGRWSAILLSLFPPVMFLILQLIAPSFYNNIWNDPLVFPVLGFGIAWTLIGDYIMYRMVTFDF